ncbi:MAG TPA: helix-turn-helix transcriptional regulator [Acidobacteriota bacterium]|nr:helix-turn-helix transcriptional regulator [Acidobacteriota bacterium]
MAKKEATLKPHWFQILLALGQRDLHGLGIMQDVLERTEGTMHLWPGMLYGALKDLCARGWIEEVEAPEDAETGGGKPRFYRLTSRGRAQASAEARRLHRYVEAARARDLLGQGKGN